MIDRAQKTIELEYFIFLPDRSGRLVLQAIVKKAREGVKVRILLDYVSQAGTPGLDEFYQVELAKNGIELRYFNVASMVEFWKSGFRNHRKFIIIDGQELVTGGRNIADEYFGLRGRINYLDRDIWIKGPIVQTATRNFELFWNAPMVRKLEEPEEKACDRICSATSSRSPATGTCGVRPNEFLDRVAKVNDTLTPQSGDAKLRQKVARLGGPALARSPVVNVHAITFVSDKPVPCESGRIMAPYLRGLLEHANKKLLVENYTFLVKSEDKDILLDLAKRGVQIDLLTNSFFSEPNFVLAELSHSREHMAVLHGMNVYCYSAKPKSDQVFLDQRVEKTMWGLHGKSMVIDGKDAVITSYNFDPRSARINVENAICVHDSPEFARLLEEATMSRIRNAYRINQEGRYVNGPCCYGMGRTLAIVLRPLAELFADQL